MNPKDFAKYWKAEKKNKSFLKCVPKFDKKKMYKKAINELFNNDFRKLDYENRIAMLRTIFGNPKKQFKGIEKELKKSIKIGLNVKIEKSKK